jgi:hypothetical protein
MMQPQPPIQKKGSIINPQNKFAQTRRSFGSTEPVSEPQPQLQYREPPQHHTSHLLLTNTNSTFGWESGNLFPDPDKFDHSPDPEEPLYQQPYTPYKGPVSYQTIEETGFEPELTTEQIEQSLANEDQMYREQNHGGDDEREFMGGKKLYDRQLMQQPMYDEPTMQILNDIASDESFPILVQYITQLSHLGRQAQARLIARASAFQSKNQVFSNIQNQNDYMMAQDDFAYAQIMSKCDYSTYDTNADYFTAEAIMEAQFNIRLRRSRNALNLLQINTQRQESIMSQHPAQEEERKLRSKIPFLGQFMG